MRRTTATMMMLLPQRPVSSSASLPVGKLRRSLHLQRSVLVAAVVICLFSGIVVDVLLFSDHTNRWRQDQYGSPCIQNVQAFIGNPTIIHSNYRSMNPEDLIHKLQHIRQSETNPSVIILYQSSSSPESAATWNAPRSGSSIGITPRDNNHRNPRTVINNGRPRRNHSGQQNQRNGGGTFSRKNQRSSRKRNNSNNSNNNNHQGNNDNDDDRIKIAVRRAYHSIKYYDDHYDMAPSFEYIRILERLMDVLSSSLWTKTNKSSLSESLGISSSSSMGKHRHQNDWTTAAETAASVHLSSSSSSSSPTATGAADTDAAADSDATEDGNVSNDFTTFISLLDQLDKSVMLESRPIQERTIGLLSALLVLVAPHPNQNSHRSNVRSYHHQKQQSKQQQQIGDDQDDAMIQRLWESSKNILNQMVHDRYIPSVIPITSLYKNLKQSHLILVAGTNNRKKKRLDGPRNNIGGSTAIVELLQIVSKMKSIQQQQQQDNNHKDVRTLRNQPDLELCRLIGWNTYLSSLLEEGRGRWSNNDSGDVTYNNNNNDNDDDGKNSVSNHDGDTYNALRTASNLLKFQHPAEPSSSNSSNVNSTSFVSSNDQGDTEGDDHNDGDNNSLDESFQWNDIVILDVSSYNLVMNVAAKLGQTEIVQELWNDLRIKQKQKQQQLHRAQSEELGEEASVRPQSSSAFNCTVMTLEPDSRTYTARLIACKDNDSMKLSILDKELMPYLRRRKQEQSNPNQQSVDTPVSAEFKSKDEDINIVDSFAAEVLLVPLAEAGRMDDLFIILDHIVDTEREKQRLDRDNDSPKDGLQRNSPSYKKHHDPMALQKAFSSFLLRPMQDGVRLTSHGGDSRSVAEGLAVSRQIFDRYIWYFNSDAYSAIDTHRVVPADRRHFNILLEGYARVLDEISPLFESSKAMTIDNTEEEGQILETISNLERDLERRDDAIASAWGFFEMMKTLNNGDSRDGVRPDLYTWTTMTKFCQSGKEIQQLLDNFRASSHRGDYLPPSLIRAAITASGLVGDPSLALKIFKHTVRNHGAATTSGDRKEVSMEQTTTLNDTRLCNVLLGSLAESAKQFDNPSVRLDGEVSGNDVSTDVEKLILSMNGTSCSNVTYTILNTMSRRDKQSYMVSGSCLQYDQGEVSSQLKGLKIPVFLLRKAVEVDRIAIDGKVINSILRCWGEDISGALDHWKSEIRQSLKDTGRRTRRKGGRNSNFVDLLAAYSGLLYVCGRALRPDIAVRIVYAMKKEGISVSEQAFQNYKAGKRRREQLLGATTTTIADEKNELPERSKVLSNLRIAPKLKDYMVSQYESVLYVECKTYNVRDRRTENDARVRIIV